MKRSHPAETGLADKDVSTRIVKCLTVSYFTAITAYTKPRRHGQKGGRGVYSSTTDQEWETSPLPFHPRSCKQTQRQKANHIFSVTPAKLLWPQPQPIDKPGWPRGPFLGEFYKFPPLLWGVPP